MKREVKIGIFAVAMIGVAWAGIRFLKGFDIFSRNVEYYAAYDQINGVQNASPIMMKGVKIGSVTGLSFDPARSDKVVLQFTIKRQYRIPTDSEAKIFSNGLMGAKAIEITYGTADTYLQKGDTLRSSRDRDLMDMAGSELDFFKQKVSQLTTDLSRTLENLNGLMETNADNIAGTLGNLNSVTGDMAEILSAEKNSLKSALDNLSKFSDMLGENAGRVDSIIGDVDRFTSQLTEEQFARKLSQAVEHLDGLVARIAQGEGTVGKLISAPELYDSLEKASDNLAALLADVKQYPGRYVHLSLFGRNPEKMKERADRLSAIRSGGCSSPSTRHKDDLSCKLRAEDRLRPASGTGCSTLYHACRPREARRRDFLGLGARDRTEAGTCRPDAPAARHGARFSRRGISRRRPRRCQTACRGDVPRRGGGGDAAPGAEPRRQRRCVHPRPRRAISGVVCPQPRRRGIPRDRAADRRHRRSFRQYPGQCFAGPAGDPACHPRTRRAGRQAVAGGARRRQRGWYRRCRRPDLDPRREGRDPGRRGQQTQVAGLHPRRIGYGPYVLRRTGRGRGDQQRTARTGICRAARDRPHPLGVH